MAVKQTSSTKRAASRSAKASGATKVAVSNGTGRVRRVRMGRLDLEFHEPAEKDPKKRAEAIREATSMIKTTARLSSIHPRWDD